MAPRAYNSTEVGINIDSDAETTHLLDPRYLGNGDGDDDIVDASGSTVVI